MIAKKILIMGCFLVEVFTLKVWLSCQRFSDMFHFSSLDAKLKIEDAIHNDIGYLTFIARFFHNKVTVYTTELFNKYIYFGDIRFSLLFFSIVGLFGVLYSFWILFIHKKRTKKVWLFLGFLLVIPFVEVFQLPLPYWVRLSIIALPYQLFSLYGLWHFMKRHKRRGVFIIMGLLILSIWYIAIFQKDIFNIFCYN